MTIFNAFTVDVEEHFQVSGFAGHIEPCDWDSHESRVVANTERILELLDRTETKSTFFIVGWVAEKFPELVQRIHNGGHEIGSHSYWHQLIYEQRPDEFRDDLRRSRDVLQDILGQRICAFRAPSFSITKDSLWALEILVQEGFEIDSSISSLKRQRCGIAEAPSTIYRIETPSGSLWEFPPSTLSVVGRDVSLAGGGYFRLFPFALIANCLNHLNRELSRPFMFYFHPWEVDPTQPRLHVGSRMNRFRHYVNLSRSERKLSALFEQFRFGSLTDVIFHEALRGGFPTEDVWMWGHASGAENGPPEEEPQDARSTFTTTTKMVHGGVSRSFQQTK